jgi:hypothetical protein
VFGEEVFGPRDPLPLRALFNQTGPAHEIAHPQVSACPRLEQLPVEVVLVLGRSGEPAGEKRKRETRRSIAWCGLFNGVANATKYVSGSRDSRGELLGDLLVESWVEVPYAVLRGLRSLPCRVAPRERRGAGARRRPVVASTACLYMPNQSEESEARTVPVPGVMPTSPQIAAGERTEPSASVPCAHGTRPAATVFSMDMSAPSRISAA